MNSNLNDQCKALEYCWSCLDVDERKALLEAVRVIQKFNYDMMRLYDAEEIEANL